MDQTTSKSNEAKWKMKHPYEIARRRFEPRCYRFVANRATIYVVFSSNVDFINPFLLSEVIDMYCIATPEVWDNAIEWEMLFIVENNLE